MERIAALREVEVEKVPSLKETFNRNPFLFSLVCLCSCFITWYDRGFVFVANHRYVFSLIRACFCLCFVSSSLGIVKDNTRLDPSVFVQPRMSVRVFDDESIDT